jgi:hypothetical protein
VARPSKFKQDFIKQAEKLCALGATDEDLADFFQVSIRTINNWKAEHVGFLQSLKGGKETADERVERSLYQKAIGYTSDAVKIFVPKGSGEPVIVPYREHVAPDTTAAIFWLKNRKPEAWRDMSRHEHTGKDGGAIETESKTDGDVAKALVALLHRSGDRV